MSFSAHVLTLFPDMFPGPLGSSLAGKALEKGLWALDVIDIRDFAEDKHRTIDDTPAGGGPGMVMRADVLGRAIDHTRARANSTAPVFYLSPRGKVFNQKMAVRFAKLDTLILICGRFEGVDERVLESREIEEISIGDFILSGGEPAALVVLHSVIRLLPGVMGDTASMAEESFNAGLLEYPQYTRPQVWEDQEIPEVLTSGHHEKIKAWKLEMSENLTRQRRPDLWEKYVAGIKNKKVKS